MDATPPIPSIIPDLSDLGALRTPFAIVGGVATTLYMPQRLTQDLDILVVVADVTRLSHELEELGATRRGDLSIGGSSWELPNGLALDVLESAAPWARDAVAHPVRTSGGWPVIDLPYLVVLKMEASRERDLSDVAAMLAHADEPALAAVRAAVDRYVPDAAEDLESLRAIGVLERQAREQE